MTSLELSLRDTVLWWLRKAYRPSALGYDDDHRTKAAKEDGLCTSGRRKDPFESRDLSMFQSIQSDPTLKSFIRVL